MQRYTLERSNTNKIFNIYILNDGLLLLRKSEHKGTNVNRKDQDGCQAFKNILGLQIITSMLAISTIYFYSDQEYLFPGGFQCAHLLLQTRDAGIRPLPVCLYRTLGCTLRNSWLSPGS